MRVGCSLRASLAGGLKAGVFFRRLLKNSRTKKLKLKENFPKTQGFFAGKLKKPENFGQISVKILNFSQKMTILGEKNENFLKTQGFFENSSPKSVKNSRNRKLHLPSLCGGSSDLVLHRCAGLQSHDGDFMPGTPFPLPLPSLPSHSVDGEEGLMDSVLNSSQSNT